MPNQLRKVVVYDCVARHHLVARCPYCDTGVLMATCPDDFKGIMESPCSDCGQTVAFYVLMKEHKAWLLAEPLEVATPQPARKTSEADA